MYASWRGRDTRPAGRWVNIEELNNALKDTQRGCVMAWKSSSGSFSTSAREYTSRDQPDANPEPEYVIDPITNRKVFRKPAESFKGYRAQFQDSQSRHKDDPSVQADPTREVLKEFETAESHKPFFAYEPDGKIPDQVQEGLQEGLQDFDSGENYKPYFAYEPDGKIPEAPDLVQQGLKEFETSEMYRPYFAYEPDGKIPDPPREGLKDFGTTQTHRTDGEISNLVQEGLEEYEAGKSYEPYFAYEPDGKIPNSVEDGLKEYETGKSYEPYFAYEPDGKIDETIPNTVEEGLKEYDAGASYEPYFAYEPDGKIEEEIPNQIEEGLKEYDTGVSYAPYFAYEPDGKIPSSAASGPLASDSCPVQEGLKDYDSKASYGPVLYNQPDGKFADISDPVQKGLADYDRAVCYGVRPTDELTSSLSTEPQTSAGKLHDFDNLVVYGSGQNRSPSVDQSSGQSVEGQNRKMTGNFVRDFPEEFQGKWTLDKNDYQALAPESQVDAWGYDKTPQGLELSYEREVQNQEKEFIDGLASTESFAAKPDIPRIQTSLDRSTAATDTSDNPAEEVRQIRARYAQEEGTAEERKLQNEMDPYSKEPQGLETQFAEERRLEIEMDPYSKKPQGLETHFQEERKLENEMDPYSKKPQGLETSYIEECAAQKVEGQNPAKHGEVLSEQDARSQYNREKKILKRHRQDLVHEVRAIYEEKYGKIDSEHRQVPVATDSQPVEGRAMPEVEWTQYKVLAYDPSKQQVTTAETTSTVPDHTSPMTPPEALSRLENGEKFITHFDKLEAQGYEIVSAGKNMLVFRKVEPTKSSSYLDRSKNTNPIDGMRGSPVAATGNFASPTGFVNHDLPGDPDHHFNSNPNVHLEEGVFSGRSNWTNESRWREQRNSQRSRSSEDTKNPRRKKMDIAKKMALGAVWLGGLSYTCGVVAQYFKTGGIDGLGPQGF